MDTDFFANPPVSLSQLPKVDELHWQALSPRYVLITLCLSMAITVVLSLLWLAALWQPWFPLTETWAGRVLWGGLSLSVLGILHSFYCYFAYPKKVYALRAHDLSFQSGLFFQNSVTQPILRIQHIELKRGPLERLAGLATLQVFSAGGALHTFEIPGLPLADAEQIRQLILQHKDAQQHD